MTNKFYEVDRIISGHTKSHALKLEVKIMAKYPYEWEDLINKEFSYHTVEIKERPDELWIQLQEGIDLDKYVWRFTDIKLNKENLLEFAIECINSLEGVPEELYQYAASMIMKSLEEAIRNDKS